MKRTFITIIGVALLNCLAGLSYAQEISSSYDTTMAATAPAEKPTSGYDNGFFIGSKDGDFKVGIGTRLNPMFYYEASNLPDNPTTPIVDESASTFTFRLKSAQIWMSPSWKNLKGFLLIGASLPTATSNTYWVGNVTYEFNPHIYIKMGSEDPTYDLTSIMSGKKLIMADSPLVVTQKGGEQPVWQNVPEAATIARPSFGLEPQLGLFLGGTFFDDRFGWAASVGNGSESTTTSNTNKDFQYSLRLSHVVLGKDPGGDMTDLAYSETPSFAIGAGGALETDDMKNTTTGGIQYKWAMDGTADAEFRYRGFSLNAAGYYRKIRVGPAAVIEAGNKYLTDAGYLATLGMFIIPKKFEIQAFGDQTFRQGPDNDVYEFGGGLNYYLKGHNAKLQADFSRAVVYDAIVGTNNRVNNRFRLKFQMYL